MNLSTNATHLGFFGGARKPWNILTRILLFSSALMIHWRSRPWNKTSWLVRREGVFFVKKSWRWWDRFFFFRKQGPCYLWNSGCTIRQCKVKAFRTAKCDSNFLENISSTGFIVETGINDSIVAFDAFLFGVIWQILPAMRYTTPWVPFFFVRNFNSMPLESLGWCFSVVFSFLADFLVGSKNSLTKGCETQHAAAGDTPQNKLYQQAI